jgi:menaquinone-dependent protoporphyrinogen oxidase
MTTSPVPPLAPPAYVPHCRCETSALAPLRSRIAIFYATREGHTLRIAGHIAADLLRRGFDVDVNCVREPIPFSLLKYSAAILAASVHGGRHEREMVQFVRDHRAELDRMTTAFLSVTLSEAGVEKRDASAEQRAKFEEDVEKMLGTFFSDTNWLPTFTRPVAGALLYSRYNFLVRLVMKAIARRAGADTDTSHDYDYTNWEDLDRFVGEFAGEAGCTGTAALRPGSTSLAA